MEHICNIVTLRGSLQALPQFSHENHGKRFYRFCLEVPRLSGAVDILPVIAESSLLDSIDPTAGEMITVMGQIRSHNSRENGVRRLLIFVYAGAVLVEDGPPINDVTVCGPLCKEPVYRRTPLGREICDVMLAIPRAFHRADYLPVSSGDAPPERWRTVTYGTKSPSAADYKAGSTPSRPMTARRSVPPMKFPPSRHRYTLPRNKEQFPLSF